MLSFFEIEKKIMIENCVHYCGFQYGTNDSYNPYQSYLRELIEQSTLFARNRLIRFMQFYRPQTMHQALGIQSQAKHPMWVFPWSFFFKRDYKRIKSWRKTPSELPDILTHFCSDGILSYRIEQEFYWLEKAYHSISGNGYDPKRYNSYIQFLTLEDVNGNQRHLLLDGNHRVSSMAVMGIKTAIGKQKGIIHEKKLKNWAGVKNGTYTANEAKEIFQAYFEGNTNYVTTDIPAKIICNNGWREIYDIY